MTGTKRSKKIIKIGSQNNLKKKKMTSSKDVLSNLKSMILTLNRDLCLQ